MKTEHLGLEEIEALTSARLGDMRKKINAASWTDNMELLMKLQMFELIIILNQLLQHI